MEHVTQTDPDRKARLMKGLDDFLERERDRELFDLSTSEVVAVACAPGNRRFMASDDSGARGIPRSNPMQEGR